MLSRLPVRVRTKQDDPLGHELACDIVADVADPVLAIMAIASLGLNRIRLPRRPSETSARGPADLSLDRSGIVPMMVPVERLRRLVETWCRRAAGWRNRPPGFSQSRGTGGARLARRSGETPVRRPWEQGGRWWRALSVVMLLLAACAVPP